MFQPLDGPAKSSKIVSLTTTTAVEVKKDATAFEGRHVITMQSTSKDTNYGAFWVYLADTDETPNAATVSANGFFHPANSVRSYEAGGQQLVWIVAFTGTIDVRFSERG